MNRENFPSFRLIVDGAANATHIVDGRSGSVTRLPAAFGKCLAPDRLAEAVAADPATTHHLRRAVAMGFLSDDRRSLRGIHREVPVSPHFMRLQIETTLTCNLRCSYCYCEAGPQRTDSLPLDLALAAIGDADRLGCIYVDLTGGELFAYRYWQELAAEVRRRGMILTVHTNGLSLDPTKIEALLELGTNQVLVAFESHLAEVHDRVRGRPGALKRTAENVRRAVQSGLSVHASLMVHRINQESIGDTLHWLVNDLGVSVSIDRITAYGRGREKKHDPQGTDIGLTTAEFFETIAPHVNRLREGAITERRVCDSGAGTTFGVIAPHCGVAHNFAFITASGEIALCPTMTSREEEQFQGPNLAQTSLYEAWIGHPLFLSTRFLNCRNVSKCPSGQRCGGGCRSNAYADAGELDAPDYLECNLHKNPTDRFVDFSELYDRNLLSPPRKSDAAIEVERADI